MPCSPGARLTPGSPARRRRGRSCGGRTRRRTAASTCAAAWPRCRLPRVRARPTAGMPGAHLRFACHPVDFMLSQPALACPAELLAEREAAACMHARLHAAAPAGPRVGRGAPTQAQRTVAADGGDLPPESACVGAGLGLHDVLSALHAQRSPTSLAPASAAALQGGCAHCLASPSWYVRMPRRHVQRMACLVCRFPVSTATDSMLQLLFPQQVTCARARRRGAQGRGHRRGPRRGGGCVGCVARGARALAGGRGAAAARARARPAARRVRRLGRA